MEYQIPAEKQKQGNDAPQPHSTNGGAPPPPPYRYPSPDGTMPADGALNNSYLVDVEAAGDQKKPSRAKAYCCHCADECCLNLMAGVVTGVLWFFCCCGGQGCNC